MTVRKRYNKYYYTDFYIKGKRIVRKVPGNIANRRASQNYEDDLKLKMLKGEIGIRQTDSELSSLISKYLGYSKTNKAPSSYIRDELALRTFSNHTGYKKLSEVTPIALEKWLFAQKCSG